MKLIIADTYEQMSEYAKTMLLGVMMQDKQVNIVLTSGRSPKKMYELLIPEVKGNKAYENVEYFFFDENPHTNRPYGLVFDAINEMYFAPCEIPMDKIHYPELESYSSYDNEIEAAGGIDLAVIGLGADGHFAANVPFCTPMTGYTYTVSHEEKRSKNPSYPPRPYEPVTISMGPASFMKMKQLMMIVNGREKAEALKKLVDIDCVDEAFPSSVLKLHPNFTIIADREAAEYLVKEETY